MKKNWSAEDRSQWINGWALGFAVGGGFYLLMAVAMALLPEHRGGWVEGSPIYALLAGVGFGAALTLKDRL